MDKRSIYIIIKRMFDFMSAFMGLIVISPFFIPIMLILKFTGEGEIFFIQKRIGRFNKPFGLIKFATMLKDSPKTGTVTAKHDPRILPIGKILRNTKINELPQIINVLKGDMSLVGYRPLTDEVFYNYTEDVKKCLWYVRPGITGLGSIIFRNEEEILYCSKKSKMECYREDILPLKGALEQWYFKHRNFWLDIKIIIATFMVVLMPKSKFYLKWFDIRQLIEESTLKKFFI